MTTVPFSYAQAAKGLSTSAAASTQQSSGTTTPAKDATNATAAPTTAPVSAPSMPPLGSVQSWADDAEAELARTQKPAVSEEISAPKAAALPKQPIVVQTPVTTSNISSPELSAMSASTIAKDDDSLSLQNASSESASTWENKSQASTSVEKSSEPAEKRPASGKERSAYKAPKPLQEAPVPAVNAWTRRAEELKKASKNVVAPKQATIATPVVTNGTSHDTSSQMKKDKTGLEGSEPKGPASSETKKPHDEKVSHSRKEAKPDADSDKSKKGVRGRPHEKESKSAAAAPLLPERDQESWPTPEIAVDEDRKRAQGKGEKTGVERKDGAPKPHGKQDWVTLPYTPTVVFSTPLPGAASARRGGRGGGRGGAQGSGRTAGHGTNGAGNSDRDSPATTAALESETSKRGRSETAPARDASPKATRTGSAGSATVDPKSPVEEKASKETEGQHNTQSRQHPQTRSNRGRKGDAAPQTEKKKDGEESSAKDGRRASIATQTDFPEESDKRTPTAQEGPNGNFRSNERRFNGTFSGRGRGGRGGRGGHQNNGGHHAFANPGHAPNPPPTTFPLRSPTTFHPEQSAFFPAGTQPGRAYRNGNRSHSVTMEGMYGRTPGYTEGSPLAPIQTGFTPGMYDYSMVHPMSAAPFNPYNVDHSTLFKLVNIQLDYYFSVNNLCKDLFLRKHMDSQGFVYLSFITEFNRMKSLTTDFELVKLVCHHSPNIEMLAGADGKERVRARFGWDKWVLSMSQRDPSVQNDGPEELHNAPIAYSSGFDHAGQRHLAGSANSSVLPSDGPGSSDSFATGQATNGSNGFAGTNGHLETSTKAVSGEPDSFSNSQVESLSVIVRKQLQQQVPALPLYVTRTFSNGSCDSKSAVLDGFEKVNGRHSALTTNGTSPAQGFESNPQDGPRKTLCPFVPSFTPAMTPMTPMQLYWVKGKDAPVDSLPPNSSYEFYTHLRFKALEQRESAAHGSCPYDMDVLYQFWSHFLIRNFNLQMYQEFRHFAFEDSAHRGSEIGLTNLIKYYGEALLSNHSLIRELVARDYVDLVKSETSTNRPAYQQLRNALLNCALDPRNRKRIVELLDDDLLASLE